MGNILKIFCSNCNQEKKVENQQLINVEKRNNSYHSNSITLIQQESKIENLLWENMTTEQSINLDITDFCTLGTISKAAFSEILMVQMKADKKNTKYAMKIIKKKDQQKVANILIEETILMNCQHPYIIDLKYSFQSEKKIFLVMEYVQGGNLFEILQKSGKLNEKIARFIFSQVVLGIKYLHEVLNIKYRDLKPENILLNDEGNVKIVDFGVCKIDENPDEKSDTFVGTAEYLAPEIILGQGHTKNVDLWSLGILLFEMMAGYPPYSDEDKNLANIQKLIIQNQINFPSHFSKKSMDLIKGLLQNKPEERLGANDFRQIMDHPFFEGIDWDQLLEVKVQSPIKSQIKFKQKSPKLNPRAIYGTPLNTQYSVSQYSYLQGLTYIQDQVIE